MSTSANATEVAVRYQWNDLFTQTDEQDDLPRASCRRSPSPPPTGRSAAAIASSTASDVVGYVYPWKGEAARGDRVITT